MHLQWFERDSRKDNNMLNWIWNCTLNIYGFMVALSENAWRAMNRLVRRGSHFHPR